MSTPRLFVAELEISLDTLELFSTNEHVFNIETLSLNKLDFFKKMFYAQGGDQFAFAHPPTDTTHNSPWFVDVSGWEGTLQPGATDVSGGVHAQFHRLGGKSYIEALTSDHTGSPHEGDDNVVTAYYLGSPSDLCPFYAEKEVVPNMECDLGVEKDKWTNVSRQKILDQLEKLSWSHCGDSGDISVTTSRPWSAVKNLCTGVSKADLVLELVVKNGNPSVKNNRLIFTFHMDTNSGASAGGAPGGNLA